MKHDTFFACLGFVAGVSFCFDAAADWPMPRQNARRTAVAQGLSDISQPATFWRFFAGGVIGSSGVVALDVDGDGKQELVMCSARRVIAKRPATNDVVWQNTGTDCHELVGVSDLDGDGEDELVVRSENRVFVLRVSDGTTHWGEPMGEMGTIGSGGVRVGDLDGDQRSDILIQECGCCGVNSGNTGFAYKFSGGGASLAAPKLLWTLPVVACGGTRAATLARMRSTSAADVVLGVDTELQLVSGTHGKVVATTGNFGKSVQLSRCQAVNVDDTPTEELLCGLVGQIGPPNNGRRVFLVRYVQNPVPKLQIDWQVLVGVQDGQVNLPPSWVADLDADGTPEVVVAGKNADDSWTTQVLDARFGTKLGSVEGHQVVGTAPIVPSGRSVVLTEKDGELFGWRLAVNNTPSMVPLWSLPGRKAVVVEDLQRSQRSFLRQEVLSLDFDQDGIDELVTMARESSADLTLSRTSNGFPEQLGIYQAPVDTTLLTAWHFPPQGGGLGLVVAQSDGNMHLLDSMLQPASGDKTIGASFGGFYSTGGFRQLSTTPLLGIIDLGAPGLLVSNSSGALLRLDASSASLSQGPATVWSRPRTSGALIVPGLNAGASGLLALETASSGNQQDVVALSASGQTLWVAPLPGVALTDVLWGKVNGDPVAYVQYGDPNDTMLRTRALSGGAGQTLWEATPYGPGNRQPAGAAVADWDGDGSDDLVFQQDATRVISGASGNELLSSPAGPTYFMPIVADVDADNVDEVTLFGGLGAPRTLSHDLQSILWIGDGADRPMPYGALVACPGLPQLLVGSSLSQPARIRFIATAGATAGSEIFRVLAGGAMYLDEAAAEQAQAQPGALSSPVVHSNLKGDGRAKLLVGSTDGWLYGLDPCSSPPELAFTVNFGSPVGSVVFGDTDGDGLDEIVASVADGYLYGLKQTHVQAVAEVFDTDPPSGITSEDVDEIETFDTLYASWTAVAGADGYELAVVRDALDGGGFLQGWTAVGPEPSAAIGPLSLADGKRYFITVRAVEAGQVSPDTMSDGVRVHLLVPADAGAGGSGGAEPEPTHVLIVGRSCLYCAANVSRSEPHGWLSLVGLLALLGLRRRKLGFQ